MYKLKNFILLLITVLLLQGCLSLIDPKPTKFTSDKPVLMFILDTSGSMNEVDSLRTKKIKKAEESIINTINQLNTNIFNTSLITFDNCKAKVSASPSDKAEHIIAITKQVTAYGKTPLADAIKLSGNVLSDVEKKMVILISDGKETCGGNAYLEAEKLYKKYGVNIDFQIIGYEIDQETRDLLKKISKVSKEWKYYDAKDSKTLNKVVKQIIFQKDMQNSIWIDPENYIFQFSSGSSNIKQSEEEKILGIYKYLKSNTEKILIIGHTDSIGSKKSNYSLSKKRAFIVQQELIKLGISLKRIKILGKGEDEPIAKNDTEKGREKNRRVQVKIIE